MQSRPYHRLHMAIRWVGAYAVPLWIAIGFTLMGLAAIFATAPSYLKVWPPLFFLVAILSAASIFRPDSPKIGAACGSLLAMLGVARVLAVLDYYQPIMDNPHAILHALLWGLHVVVGLRWPQVVYESTLRHALDEAKNQPEEPGYDVKG